MDIQKILIYDKFKCIADKCNFTCCEGWDVFVDTCTYNKWKENYNLNYLLDNLKIKEYKDKKEYFINKETHEKCPMLDDNGLCQIVKSHGEECLSSTCHSFPRIENNFGYKKEFSLSCACPEVVELLEKENGKIIMISENHNDCKDNLLELNIRKAIINIVEYDGISLEKKLIIAFEMLLNILKSKNVKEDTLISELKKYKNVEYIRELIKVYEEIDFNIDESMEELSCLFLDIIENYKEVSGLEEVLGPIGEFGEEVHIEILSENWNKYKTLFEKHNKLLENCIISKILSSCVNEDIEHMITAFQTIILEYILVRYAVYLEFLMNENEEVNIKDVKDYIVVFSRVIGNNIETVLEFLREGFGDEILEIGYLCFIGLF